MYKGGPSRTGEADGIGPVAPAAIAWSVPSSGVIKSSPVVVAGVLSIVAGDGSVVALGSADGAPRWTSAKKDYAGSPDIAGKRLFVIAGDSSIAALDLTDGHEIWRASGSFIGNASPLPLDDLVIVGGTTGGLVAFDAATGDVRWTYPTKGSIVHGASTADDVVYVGSEDGILHAVAASTGLAVWTLDAKSTHFATTAVRDGVVYAMASTESAASVLAVAATTGKVIWTFEPPAGTKLRTPSVTKDAVYVSGIEGGLFVLNATDGSRRWTFSGATVTEAAIGIAGHVVYAFTTDRKVNAFDPVTGEVQWSVPLKGVVDVGTTIASGMLFAGDSGGNIFAVGTTPSP